METEINFEERVTAAFNFYTRAEAQALRDLTCIQKTLPLPDGSQAKRGACILMQPIKDIPGHPKSGNGAYANLLQIQQGNRRKMVHVTVNGRPDASWNTEYPVLDLEVDRQGQVLPVWYNWPGKFPWSPLPPAGLKSTS